MDGATLRLLDSIRGVSFPGGPHTQTALEAFARLLYGRPHDQKDLHWLEGLAVSAYRQSASRAEPFRVIYDAVRVRGQRIDVTDGTINSGALALEGMMLLPLRERAALALSCLVGFTSEEIGHVIGTTPSHARAIVDAAVALIRREAGAGEPRVVRKAEPAA